MESVGFNEDVRYSLYSSDTIIRTLISIFTIFKSKTNKFAVSKKLQYLAVKVAISLYKYSDKYLKFGKQGNSVFLITAGDGISSLEVRIFSFLQFLNGNK